MDRFLKCQVCKAQYQGHFNSKRCRPCSKKFACIPILSDVQVETIKKLRGKIYVHELADEVGVSKPTLVRWAKFNNISLNALKTPDNIIEKVCSYYAKHGKSKTEKRFPNIKLRSIIERYFKGLGHEPRQIRWQEAQLIRAVQMAGLIAMDRQAAYFNRPNANRGSIRSLWYKKFGNGGGSINGLSYNLAKHYVKDACPVLLTQYWETRQKRASGDVGYARRIVLWVDVEKYLSTDVPDHLKAAIAVLAKFQRWVHGRNVRSNIKKIMETV